MCKHGLFSWSGGSDCLVSYSELLTEVLNLHFSSELWLFQVPPQRFSYFLVKRFCVPLSPRVCRPQSWLHAPTSCNSSTEIFTTFFNHVLISSAGLCTSGRLLLEKTSHHLHYSISSKLFWRVFLAAFFDGFSSFACGWSRWSYRPSCYLKCRSSSCLVCVIYEFWQVLGHSTILISMSSRWAPVSSGNSFPQRKTCQSPLFWISSCAPQMASSTSC